MELQPKTASETTRSKPSDLHDERYQPHIRLSFVLFHLYARDEATQAWGCRNTHKNQTHENKIKKRRSGNMVQKKCEKLIQKPLTHLSSLVTFSSSSVEHAGSILSIMLRSTLLCHTNMKSAVNSTPCVPCPSCLQSIPAILNGPGVLPGRRDIELIRPDTIKCSQGSLRPPMNDLVVSAQSYPARQKSSRTGQGHLFSVTSS